MPVLTGPQLSIEASGTFGKIITYFRRTGQNISRLRVIPHNPNSVNQLTIRNYFTNAVNAYQAENSNTKGLWDVYAQKMGQGGTYGFNYYVGLYVRYLIDHSGVDPTPPFLPPS